MLTLAAGALGVDLLAILLCAGLVPLLLGRLRVALIPGYLLAGVLIGPILGVVSDADRIAGLASLATVLLMFTIGLHFDFRSMKSSATAIVGVGMVSTAMTSIVLGALALAFGVPINAAAAVGMAMAMSSTAAVLKLLQQRREMHRPHGRLGFGVLLMQDLAVVVVLSIIPLLATAETSPDSPHAAQVHPAPGRGDRRLPDPARPASDSAPDAGGRPRRRHGADPGHRRRCRAWRCRRDQGRGSV